MKYGALLLETFTVDEVRLWMTLMREKVYRLCDAATRARGKLIKVVIVQDMVGFFARTGNMCRLALSVPGLCLVLAMRRCA